jgi:hypothetical protein
MRVAVTAVAAAVVGTGTVLLSITPPAPAAEARLAAAREPALAVAAQCPPCKQGPMGPIAWQQAIARPDAAEPLLRASTLSLSMGEPRVVQMALQAEDPALRELAALLLNVASGRVAGCTELTAGGHVAAVLDALDQLVARVRDGEEVPAADLAAAASAAAVVNRGEGLPEGCRG